MVKDRPKHIRKLINREINMNRFRKNSKQGSKSFQRERSESGSISIISTSMKEDDVDNLNNGCLIANQNTSETMEDGYVDIMFDRQGSRLDENHGLIAMPSLTKHQSYKITIDSPIVNDDEDSPIKQLLDRGAPYPMVVLPANGEYWMEGDYHVAARDKYNIPQFPYIDMSKCTLVENNTVFNYRRSFVGKEHQNFAGVDSKHGEVLLSVLLKRATRKLEEDQFKVILRLPERSICEIVKASVFDTDNPGPREFMRLLLVDEVDVSRFHSISLPRAGEDILEFDEHSLLASSKIGVVYQKFGQINENEFLENQDDSIEFREFLDTIGTCVELKDFDKYRGGLDTQHGLTGGMSYFTEYKSRQIMFHVSTLLPYNLNDPQHIERKRHIGNDIVAIIFQDRNTPFTPKSIRTHFIHVYIVVQVEESDTQDTYYKVSVVGKDGVPKFHPLLPSPSIFKKGPEFREFLITKLLNAETAAYKSENFAKLVNRTRVTRLTRLVGDFISDNERILSDEASSPIERSENPKNSSIFSSFRSALRKSSRTEAFICSTTEALSSAKKYGQSLSLNDITCIKPDKKKIVPNKKQPSPPKEKHKRSDKVNLIANPNNSLKSASDPSMNVVPTNVSPVKSSDDCRTGNREKSRSFTNNLFDVSGSSRSLPRTAPPARKTARPLSQLITSDSMLQYQSNTSLSDEIQEIRETDENSIEDIELLRNEIAKLKRQNMQLILKNNRCKTGVEYV